MPVSTPLLAPVARQRILTDLGVVAPGAKWYTWAAGGTVTPQPTYSDHLGTPNTNPVVASAGGLFGPVYVDVGVAYNFVITTAAGAAIWSQDYVNANATGAADVFVNDFGADPTGATDSTAAIQAAILNQALVTGGIGGGTVRFGPGTYLVSASMAAPTIFAIQYTSIRLVGAGMRSTRIKTVGTGVIPINFIKSSIVSVEQMQIWGPGATSTVAGVQFDSTQIITMDRVEITGFNIGLRFCGDTVPAIPSFWGQIRHCRIVGNTLTNIACDEGTSAVSFYDCTFGHQTCPIGMRITDGSNINVYGGDCSGCATNAIDIDATGGVVQYFGGVIQGVHFEDNHCVQGTIRIGKTGGGSSLRGFVIQGNMMFEDGATNICPLNLDHVDGVVWQGNAVAGFITPHPIVTANTLNFRSDGNSQNFATPDNWAYGQQGFVTFTGAAIVPVVVTFPTALTGSPDYKIRLASRFAGGTPAAGSTRAYVSTVPTNAGFTVSIEVAPGVGNTVRVDWSFAT